MNAPTLSFRPAAPEDADAVVPLMVDSSRALLDYNFGLDVNEPHAFIRRDFLRGAGLFGYLNQIVGVTSEGELVTTITAYAGRDFKRLTFKTVVSALVHFGPARFFSVVRRSLAVAPLFIDPKPDGLFIANGCVVPAYRSKGIFTDVLSHVAMVAKDRNLERVELDVSFDNPRAQALYARVGFAITGERADTRGHGLPGFRRMEKAA